jgi:orotidine-5'-phosphate decarboxylase
LLALKFPIFADRIAHEIAGKKSIAVLGVDPQLDTRDFRGIPAGYTIERFCCEIVEACAPYVAAIKPQFAFFEARGIDGMRALAEVIKLGRSLGLPVIGDAKRGDIGTTSAAYAEAILGDGDFGCDAVTVNPYQGGDTIMPFIARIKTGRGLFVLVRTSNPSSIEFQDLPTTTGPVWHSVASRVRGWGSDYLGASGMSAVGAVVGATFPDDARRARELMPDTIILVPGYGAQGGTARDAIAGARPTGSGVIVNASRSLMYAFAVNPGRSPGEAAASAAIAMRDELAGALKGK